MKLRYYLRGLGVGILVTAVIMTVALSKKQPMTDDEVIKRAKELGMIENTIIKDVATPKDDEEVKIILEKNKYPLINDDMVIVVSKKNGVKVEEEKSPQKICSKQGWVNRVDTPVVCLPNSVYVVISDINDINIDIGLQ